MECIGASILPFAICKRTNGIFFLLGKEKFHKNFGDSDKWADFGGRVDRETDKCAADIAAREFWEETNGCIRYFALDILPRRNYTDIAKSLKNGEYLHKFSFAIGKDKEYVTYLKEIPLQPECMELFKHTRRQLIQKKCPNSSPFLEKSKLGWFGLPQVRAAAFDAPVLRRSTFEKDYIRRWLRNRLQTILPHFKL
jgi:8-oxo-dGTP pyrophosphatase MutT (NUDIX family)